MKSLRKCAQLIGNFVRRDAPRTHLGNQFAQAPPVFCEICSRCSGRRLSVHHESSTAVPQVQPPFRCEHPVRFRNSVEMHSQLHRSPSNRGQPRPRLQPAFDQLHAKRIGNLACRRYRGFQVDTDSWSTFHTVQCITTLYSCPWRRAGISHELNEFNELNTFNSFNSWLIFTCMVKTKSIHTEIEKQKDGLRLLVTRFRGRGLPASRYDVWLPSLGPSEKLLRSFQKGEVSWGAFSREYRAELFMDGPIDSRNKTIKNHGQKSLLRLLKTLSESNDVTLMCHCAEDEEHCHRHLLKTLLLSNRI